MCGISGIYTPSFTCEEFILFIDSLKHRGPDTRGIFRDQNIPLWLGQRRLRILDLSESANQPLTYENSGLWLVFNGEIYNFIELKQELTDLGYSFYTESDSEVILVSYLHWGRDCLHHFNGMFTFAIWDTNHQTLFLARDRFGVKPLYYLEQGSLFAFASELKAFLCLPSFTLSWNDKALFSEIQNQSSESTEITHLQGIKRLPAGCFLIWHPSKPPILRKWWHLEAHLITPPSSPTLQIEKFYELFEDACRLRLRSDIPIAVSLSGGMDSSSILATLKRTSQLGKNFPSPCSAFTASYPHTKQDELELAKDLAEKFQIPLVACEISGKPLVDALESILFHLESIFDPPIGPWKIYETMKKQGFSISIDGHGGDELLGGYSYYVEKLMLTQFFSPKKYFQLLQEMDPSISFSRLLHWKKFLIQKIQRYPWLYSFLLSFKPYTPPIWAPFLRRPDPSSYPSSFQGLNKWLYYDFFHGSLPPILRNFDRCSMAHGVEVRSPFLDYRLVCYLFSLPAECKIDKNFTKVILRKSMKPYLPETILSQKTKKGFVNPLQTWWKEPYFKTYLLDLIHSSEFQNVSFWDGKKLAMHIQEAMNIGVFSEFLKAWPYLTAYLFRQSFQKAKKESLACL